MSDKLEELRQKVADTNIDQRSLLSTDYFNTFNSVGMLLDMLPDAPELLEEVEQWKFCSYADHFRASGLDFADLAIEAYDYVPPDLLAAFEKKVNGMRALLEDAAPLLRRLHDAGEDRVFADFAHLCGASLRTMTEEGNAIIHGNNEAMNQSAIDSMF